MTSTDRVDCSRGAPLGRPTRLGVNPPADSPVLLHLRKIRLDSGGYDRGGAYWGHGGWLYEAWDNGGQVYITGRLEPQCDEKRALARAKANIREAFFPNARFYR